MSLEVTPFVNGRWRENCYLVADDRKNALVIDPGSDGPGIVSLIEEHGWQVHAVINTHGHFDHIGAVAEIKDRYAAPFYLHSADNALLKRANLYRMIFEYPDPVKVPAVNHDIALFPEGFEAGPFAVTWIATPGHTDGSVCFLIDGILFSGDTLLHGAVGRTDLPGGNRERLTGSLRKLAELPPSTVVWSGHGPMTTLGAEFADGSPARSLIA